MSASIQQLGVMRDLFPQEAETALREGVEALFLRSREAQGRDLTAYVKSLRSHPRYVAFVNGAVRPEGEPAAQAPSRLHAVRQTIEAIAAMWPNHARQALMWRQPPVYEEWAADPANDIEAGWRLYCRLTAHRTRALAHG